MNTVPPHRLAEYYAQNLVGEIRHKFFVVEAKHGPEKKCQWVISDELGKAYYTRDEAEAAIKKYQESATTLPGDMTFPAGATREEVLKRLDEVAPPAENQYPKFRVVEMEVAVTKAKTPSANKRAPAKKGRK